MDLKSQLEQHDKSKLASAPFNSDFSWQSHHGSETGLWVPYSALWKSLIWLDVLHGPADCMRKFDRISALFGKDERPNANYDSRSLILCYIDDAKEYLAKIPSSFFVIFTKSGSVPDFVYRSENANRVILLRQTQTLFYYVSLIQNCFISIINWENRLDSIVYANAQLDNNLTSTLRQLLTECAGIFDCYISIVDNGYNILVETSDIHLDCTTFKALSSTKCFAADKIEYIKKHVLSTAQKNGDYETTGKGTFSAYECIHYPLFSNGIFYFLITIVCSDECSFGEVVDCSEILMRRIGTVCSKYWDRREKIETPWHKLFERIIKKEKLDKEFVTSQLATTDIPKARSFRLFMFDISSCNTQSQKMEIIDVIKHLYSGKNYYFFFDGFLYTFCYSFEFQRRQQMLNSGVEYLNSSLLDRFSITCVFSQAFSSIDDLPFAHEQTMTAYFYRDQTLAIMGLMRGVEQSKCIPFEYAFPFALVGDQQLSVEAIDFTFEHGIFKQILNNDQKQGLDVSKILWTYLFCNCSATAASKRLNMHKNTVIYNMKKIENEYAISLSDANVRNRFLIDYCYFQSQKC